MHVTPEQSFRAQQASSILAQRQTLLISQEPSALVSAYISTIL